MTRNRSYTDDNKPLFGKTIMNDPHPYVIPGIKVDSENIIEEVYEFLLRNFDLINIKNQKAYRNSYNNLTVANIKSRKRNRSLVVARWLISYYLRKKEGMKLKEIAEYLGAQNHATIIHAHNNLDAERDVFEQFKKEFLI